MNDELRRRMWVTSMRMAFDGISAVEDMLALGGAPNVADLGMMAILIERVLRVSREVTSRAKEAAKSTG